MQLSIDPDAAAAPYEQLRRAIADQARSGALAFGTRLPTVRALAEQLGLAPNTVAHSYRELEAAGVIETRGRNGSFIAWSPDAAERRIQEAAAALAASARELGVPPERVVAIVKAALGPS